MDGAEHQASGRRLQHLKLAVVVPLTVLGLVLGAALLQRSGDLTPTAEELPAPVDLALRAASAGAAAAKLKVADGAGGTRKPTMQEVMQSKVKECARNITGDDTPRKLAPEVRKRVLDCASDIMPAMDTSALLKASADQLRAAAKDAGDEKDAEKVIASVSEPEADAPSSPASAPLAKGTANPASKVAAAAPVAPSKKR
jgi:hypothetical protein